MQPTLLGVQTLIRNPESGARLRHAAAVLRLRLCLQQAADAQADALAAAAKCQPLQRLCRAIVGRRVPQIVLHGARQNRSLLRQLILLRANIGDSQG